jgi:hypothetical protein
LFVIPVFLTLVGVVGYVLVPSHGGESRPSSRPPVVAEEPSPATVAVSFVSHPPGAEIVDTDTDEVLGTTPFTRAIERTPEPLTVEVRLDGYRTETTEVPLAKDTQLSVDLTKAWVSPKPPPKPPAKKTTKKGSAKAPGTDRSGTVNPF